MSDNDTQTFLEELFHGKPDEAAVQVWCKDDKKNHTYAVLSTAATLIPSRAQSTDVYIAAGLAPKQIKPSKTRTPAAGIAGIPGVWADIDVNGGPENKTGAARDTEQAIELAGSLLEPTIIVNSGHGIQAWWLWEDGPWMFSSADEQAHAARVVQAFQGALRAQARRMGFGLDATHDLARLMRVPGSLNHKGTPPAPVALVSADGQRYSVEQVAELAHGHLSTVTENTLALSRGEGLDFEIHLDAQMPATIHAIFGVDPD